MKDYLKDRAGIFLILLFLGGFGNFYLVFLCASHLYFQDLLYLNLLFLAAAFAGILWDFYRFKKIEKYLEGRLSLTPLEQEKLFGKKPPPKSSTKGNMPITPTPAESYK